MDELVKAAIKLAGEGSYAAVFLIIWYITYRDTSRKLAEAFRLHGELNANLIQLLKDEQEYKSMLIGILTRLEEKLRHVFMCPLKSDREG